MLGFISKSKSIQEEKQIKIGLISKQWKLMDLIYTKFLEDVFNELNMQPSAVC